MQLITFVSIEKGPVLLKPTTKRVVASLLYMSPPWPPAAADLTITIPATSTQARGMLSPSLHIVILHVHEHA